LVEIRRQETLCLRTCAHVAAGARGGDGMGGAPVLLVTIDRPPPCRLAGGSLVESSPERRLHGRWTLERGTVVGSSGYVQTRRFAGLTSLSQGYGGPGKRDGWRRARRRKPCACRNRHDLTGRFIRSAREGQCGLVIRRSPNRRGRISGARVSRWAMACLNQSAARSISERTM